MVKVSSLAQFTTDFPDDMVEDKDGRVIEFGGRAVTLAIIDMLEAIGANTSNLTNELENGWEFDIKYKGRNPWCKVADVGDDVILIIKDRWGPWFSDYPSHVELVVLLNIELRKDSRFHEIRWYAAKDRSMHGPPMDSPAG